ncbi:phage tail tape measure protein [Pelagovum sp. HNIBRBA483]|uniref:phage tail tape measure protein n=1 Tax=Pelagovum sp. HNIBRBA483 TaxID=3233341 RepID=UPI0034A0E1F1
MEKFEDEMNAFEEKLAQLGESMAESGTIAHAFRSEMDGMRRSMAQTTRDLGNLERGFSSGLRRAIDGLVIDGRGLGDVLKGLGNSISQTVYAAAMRPVTDHFGGMMAEGLNGIVSSVMPFARGGVFQSGRPSSAGGGDVVSGPQTFAMRGSRSGLMGEAGPEAILPLTRGADGRLGVQSAGGSGAVNVTMHITTPDVQSFQRSQSQIAARLGRVIGHGQRNR